MNLFFEDLHARLAPPPKPHLTCLCEGENPPMLERCTPYSEQHRVVCETSGCERSVSGPTREEALKMWRAVKMFDAMQHESRAWQREAADLLAALKYMVDVFHDDPESGRSMQHVAIEQAQDAIERATS